MVIFVNTVPRKGIGYMFRKKIIKIIAAVLAVIMMSVSVSAVSIIDFIHYLTKHFTTIVVAGTNLEQEEAAKRLYYLGFINGTGTNSDGGLEFSLERGLNRIESAIMAVRIMGAEKAALERHLPHPFTDVPEWASDYVGYLYRYDFLFGIEGEKFFPDQVETPERFMSYCLTALGYRESAGDFIPEAATTSAIEAGIWSTKEGIFTRGSAVEAMYNTLRALMKNTGKVYSDYLVSKNIISYNDAVFLIWNKNSDEVDKYMSLVGYGNGWIIPDGYYTIKSPDSDMFLNVAVNGYNQDYDGAGITLWNGTDDSTQTFRIQRTAKGTYYIYSAASKNGFGRVLGVHPYTLNAELYTATTIYAMEFNISASLDGKWVISAADNSLKGCLTADTSKATGSAVTLAEFAPDGSLPQTWEFIKHSVTNYSGEELAIFVADSMVITQGAYDTYSHMNQNAVDMQPTEGMVKAPFNAHVVDIFANYTACNAVYIQSDNMVRFADGSYDYMTICFMHDNDISDIYVGRPLAQGEYFYDCGDYGFAGGSHVHVAVYRGIYNQFTMPIGDGDTYLEDALFVPDNTYVYLSYGLNWNYISLAD